MATWWEELTHWKRPWSLERLKVGEGDDRGWDSWMPSSTWWTWIWASSGSWWWTGKPGMLQSMGLQRVRQDWATELNWTELRSSIPKNTSILINNLPFPQWRWAWIHYVEMSLAFIWAVCKQTGNQPYLHQSSATFLSLHGPWWLSQQGIRP